MYRYSRCASAMYHYLRRLENLRYFPRYFFYSSSVCNPMVPWW